MKEISVVSKIEKTMYVLHQVSRNSNIDATGVELEIESQASYVT